MCGADVSQPSLFITRTVADFVPPDHPLRALRELIDEALASLDGLLDTLYADLRKASVAPEQLIRASLLQVLYTIRSERQLVEQIQYNLLFCWFVGPEMDDRAWHHSTFNKYREWLLDHAVLPELFAAVLAMARKRNLPYEDHFSIDGTLIDAWASHKSFRRRDDHDDTPGGKEWDYRGERRTNAIHVSRTDPEAELMRKSRGQEARLRYGVHHVVENRHHLIVGVATTPAARVGEREAALDLLARLPGEHRKTVGGDKGYDTRGSVASCRALRITPQVAMNDRRRGGSALDARATRNLGHGINRRKPKRIETAFGWLKQYGRLRRPMVRGLTRMSVAVTLATTACNLLRMRNLLAGAAG